MAEALSSLIEVVLTPNPHAPQPKDQSSVMKACGIKHTAALLYHAMDIRLDTYKDIFTFIHDDSKLNYVCAKASHTLVLEEVELSRQVEIEIAKKVESKLEINISFTELNRIDPEDDFFYLVIELTSQDTEWQLTKLLAHAVTDKFEFFTNRQLAYVLDWLHRSFSYGIFTSTGDDPLVSVAEGYIQMVQTGRDTRLLPANWITMNRVGE